MRSKNIIVMTIAIAFILITIIACLAMFSIKKAEVNFAVDKDTDSEQIQVVVDEFLGKNLIFFNTNDVALALKDFNYLEVISVEKQFPNVLKISVKERREVYYLEHEGQTYLTNEDGFVLDVLDDASSIDKTKMIKLDLVNVNVTDLTLGKTMTTDCPVLMQTVFDMAKSANLTDCIKSMSVENMGANEPSDVHIYTHTGVKISILKVEERGEEKIDAALTAYDQYISDYEKGFDSLLVVDVGGNIKVTWSGNTVIGQ